MFDHRSKVLFKYANIPQENYKVPNEEASIWADHDEDSHGILECFGDDPHHAAEVFWAYEEKILNPGCMSTRHKAMEDSTVSIAESKKSKPCE